MRTLEKIRSALLMLACLMTASVGAKETGNPMDTSARTYVDLVLELGEHDPDFVDAYYGPAEWREQAKQRKRALPQLEASASDLAATLAEMKSPADALEAKRLQFLRSQVEAVRARIDLLQGKKLPFDEESRRTYGVVAPRHDESYYKEALRAVDAATPGEGTLAERAEQLRQRSIVPADKVDAVMRRGLQECRERSNKHVQLAPTEAFTVEYVRGQPWGAYNWYKGGYHSVIQINLDPPFVASRAIELSCHEGYPGHHAYNARLEQRLVHDRGWVEFMVYPLFSPQSLIAEGTADFGTKLSFPDGSLWPWVGEHLLPMAGLDPGVAAVQARVKLAEKPLRSLSIDIAREYLDGRMPREEAVRWYETYARLTPKEAERQVRFIEKYRSYVINYSYGEELVGAYIDAVAGEDVEKRWAAFVELLSNPTTPAELR